LVPSLWCNIELAVPGLDGKSEKPDLDTAIMILKTMDLEPSILIHVGNCLQAYWLFSEPWPTKPVETWRQYGRYWKPFSATVRTAFNNAGYPLAPIGDNYENLQVPGTMNRQMSGIVPKISFLLPPHGQAPARFMSEDFKRVCVHVDWSVKSHDSIPRNNPVLDLYHICLDANPSFEKLNAILASNSKFAVLWNHQVSSHRCQWRSGYDYAMAYELLKIGWQDQEIVNTLIANRRLISPGSMGKYLRRDYYQKTLGSAKKAILMEQAYMDLSAFFKITRLSSSMDKEKMVACLSQVLDLPLADIRQTRDNPPLYILLLKNEKKIRIGYLEDFYYQDGFKERIENAVHKICATIPSREWLWVTHIIIKVAGSRNDKNMELPSQVLDSLDRFLELHPPAVQDWKSAAVRGDPFISEGHLFLTSSFRVWFKENVHDMILEQDFNAALRGMGFVGKRKTIRGPDGSFNRYYRIIPWEEVKVWLGKGLERSV